MTINELADMRRDYFIAIMRYQAINKGNWGYKDMVCWDHWTWGL